VAGRLSQGTLARASITTRAFAAVGYVPKARGVSFVECVCPGLQDAVRAFGEGWPRPTLCLG
jgi:hypothetical protein